MGGTGSFRNYPYRGQYIVGGGRSIFLSTFIPVTGEIGIYSDGGKSKRK